MAIILTLTLTSKLSTQAFAKKLAQCAQLITPSLVIYLKGDLGAGKTTIARSFIQFFGFSRVKSPTYSLVESYTNDNISIHHFDCYRLNSPEELEYIGIRDYFQNNCIQLIEWAELGKGIIAPADIVIKISGMANTRQVQISANNVVGQKLLQCVN